MLAETPEIYGAERLFTRRAVNRAVGEKLVERIRWWEDYTARNRGNKVLAVASGERTKSEDLGYGDLEFVPWQIGAVM